LVDADELRRRIEANEGAWDAWSYRNALHLLDRMPSSTAPKGWTRDEVLAELAKHPDNVCEVQSPYRRRWVPMPSRVVEQWHPEVRRFDVRVVRSTPDPEWVPLTKLVGRTIHGCDDEVVGASIGGQEPKWSDGRLSWHFFPDGTLNLDDATVAVRPEAAT